MYLMLEPSLGEFILKNFEIGKIYTFEPIQKSNLNNLKKKSKKNIIKTFIKSVFEENKISKLNQVIETIAQREMN